MTIRSSLKLKISFFLIGMMTIAFAITFHINSQHDIAEKQDKIIQDVKILGTLLGSQVSTALIFDDQKTAQEMLDSLKNYPHLYEVTVRTARGEQFAQYRSNHYECVASQCSA